MTESGNQNEVIDK